VSKQRTARINVNPGRWLARTVAPEWVPQVVKMERAQGTWLAKVRALPREVVTGAIAQVGRRYRGLKERYGPGYTKAMVSAAFLALFLPIPGSAPVAVALIVVIAELHRAISGRGGFPEASAAPVAAAEAQRPGRAADRDPGSPLLPGAAGTSPRELPSAGVADVRVDGMSWRREEGREGPPSP